MVFDGFSDKIKKTVKCPQLIQNETRPKMLANVGISERYKKGGVMLRNDEIGATNATPQRANVEKS